MIFLLIFKENYVFFFKKKGNTIGFASLLVGSLINLQSGAA